MKKKLLLIVLAIFPILSFSQTFPLHDVDDCTVLPGGFANRAVYNASVTNPDNSVYAATNVSSLTYDATVAPGPSVSRVFYDLPEKIQAGTTFDLNGRFYSASAGNAAGGSGQFRIQFQDIETGTFLNLTPYDKTGGVWQQITETGILTSIDPTTDSSINGNGGFDRIIITGITNTSTATIFEDFFFDDLQLSVESYPALSDLDADLLDGNSWVYNNREGDDKTVFGGSNPFGEFNTIVTADVATPSTAGNSATEAISVELETGFSAFRLPISPIDPPFTGTVSYRIYNSTCTLDYNDITTITLRKGFNNATQFVSSNVIFNETNQWVEISIDLSTLAGDAAGDTGYNQLLISFGSNANSIGSVYFLDAIQSPNPNDPVVEYVNVPADGTYDVNDDLDFTVNFDKNITVDTAGGTPELEVTVGSTTQQATYVSGSGTQDLVFRYTVQTGDVDINGVSIGAISLNGGTIQDADSGNNSGLGLNDVDPTAGVKVFASDVTYTSANGFLPADPSGLDISNYNLTVQDGTAVISSTTDFNSVTVEPEAVLDIDSNITVVGELLFKSNATSSGQLDDATGATITGTVETEQYISANRAFRLLSPTIGGQSIANSWQQDTHITGAGGPANGFDDTDTDNPSLFTFNNSLVNQSGGAAWEAVTSTSNILSAGTPYRLFVRGDRTIDLTDNNDPATPTTLKATGDIYTGDYLPSISAHNGNFNFIGNPYQAVVDVTALTFSGDVNSNFIYIWDPSFNSDGGFVTVDTSNGTNNSGGSLNFDEFIQPGQAFFIRNKLTVTTTPSITFTEASKNVGKIKTTTFSVDEISQLTLQMNRISENGERLVDAVGLRFSENYQNEVNDGDAGKMGNSGENLALVNTNKLLSIERREIPTENQEIQLFTNNLTEENYNFKIQLVDWNADDEAYIFDSYLDTTTPISTNDVYNFSVDQGIEESTSITRFSLIFNPTTLSNIDFTESSIKIYPNPTNGRLNINLSSESTLENIKIYNLLGEMVMESKKQNLNINKLAAGVYLLEIKTTEGLLTKKVIKQ